MKKLIFLIVLLTLTSCSSYQYNTNRVESILAVTEAGDTIAVPYKRFLNDRYTNYTRFHWNNNWYYNNWRYDWQWRNNYWYFGQLDYYNNYYNNTTPMIGNYNFSNPNSKRGEKVTTIPPENDGIYVPPTPPKPPKGKKDNIRIWRNPNNNFPSNSIRNSYRSGLGNFNTPSRNNFNAPRSYSAPRSSAPTRSAPAVQSAPSGGKGSSTGKIQ